MLLIGLELYPNEEDIRVVLHKDCFKRSIGIVIVDVNDTEIVVVLLYHTPQEPL